MSSRDEDLWNWIKHGLALVRSRCRKPLPRDDVHSLNRELAITEFVVANWERKLAGSAAVWREYLARHAALQMRWYAGTVDDRTFYAESMRLLNERKQADDAVCHLRWET
jgi:hypothetical protein